MQMLVNFGRERNGALQDFWVLLLPPLFKWWCRFTCVSSLIGVVSGGTYVSALFQSVQNLPGSSLPGDGSELPVCTVRPADRTAVTGCPCEAKCVQGVLWRSVDLDRLGACQCQRANCPLHTTAGE